MEGTGLKSHLELTEFFLRVDARCCCALLFTGIEDESRKLFGVQFHPEVDLTENGVTMLKNFLYGVRTNSLQIRLIAQFPFLKKIMFISSLL